MTQDETSPISPCLSLCTVQFKQSISTVPSPVVSQDDDKDNILPSLDEKEEKKMGFTVKRTKPVPGGLDEPEENCKKKLQNYNKTKIFS